jgi:hypothetical protein
MRLGGLRAISEAEGTLKRYLGDSSDEDIGRLRRILVALVEWIERFGQRMFTSQDHTR